jgi:hypothetical protein
MKPPKSLHCKVTGAEIPLTPDNFAIQNLSKNQMNDIIGDKWLTCKNEKKCQDRIDANIICTWGLGDTFEPDTFNKIEKLFKYKRLAKKNKTLEAFKDV